MSILLSPLKKGPSNDETTFVQSKIFENYLNPVMFGILWIALAEYSQMGTHVPEF